MSLSEARRAQIDALTRDELEVAWVRAVARMRRAAQDCQDWDESAMPSTVPASVLIANAREAEAEWDYIDARLDAVSRTHAIWGPSAVTGEPDDL